MKKSLIVLFLTTVFLITSCNSSNNPNESAQNQFESESATSTNTSDSEKTTETESQTEKATESAAEKESSQKNETESQSVTESASETESVTEPPSVKENEFPVELTPLTERKNVTLALSGTDALGRKIEPASEGNGRLVGMFYTLWLGNYYSDSGETYFSNILDMSRMQKSFVYSGGGSPFNQMHFFAKPLFGYYNQRDEWVVDRHVQLFIAADIDFLAIDATNNDYYPKPLEVLLQTLEKYRLEGYKVPKIMFLTNTDSSTRVMELYKFMYKDGRYKELWFTDSDGGKNEDQKPWITMRNEHKSKLAKKISDMFYIRASQWPNEPFLKDGFPWIEFTRPQPVHNGIISVSVAQNNGLYMSNSVQYEKSPNPKIDFYNSNWGRGYTSAAGVNNKDLVNEGANFEEQWQVAIKSDARIAFVLGWNEWAALKLATDVNGVGHTVVFFDLASVEFSRDIEPVTGNYGDNYYMQLIRNIRAFKAQSGEGIKVEKAEVSSDRITEAWNTVTSGVADFSGVETREHVNAANLSKIKNKTMKNNITELRAADGGDKVFFLIGTKNEITSPSDEKWMNLLIKTAETESGYTYVIGRSRDGSRASIEKISSDGKLTKIGDADIVKCGRYLQYGIDKTLLGTVFEVKATDNINPLDDALDLYTTGDSAPYGRLNYRFTLE